MLKRAVTTRELVLFLRGLEFTEKVTLGLTPYSDIGQREPP
jgi:hypothetical protein